MPKKFHIKWAAPAKDDLEEIIEYILKTNITYAVKVMDKIDSQVGKLNMFPERCRIVPEMAKHGYFIYREEIIDYWRVIFKIESPPKRRYISTIEHRLP